MLQIPRNTVSDSSRSLLVPSVLIIHKWCLIRYQVLFIVTSQCQMTCKRYIIDTKYVTY